MIKQEHINTLKEMLKSVSIENIKLRLTTALSFENHKYELILSQYMNDNDSCFNLPLLEFKYNSIENAKKDYNALKTTFKLNDCKVLIC